VMHIGPFSFEPVSVVARRIPEDEEWEPAFAEVFELYRNAPWWIGDMLLMAEQHMGDDAMQMIPETASERQTSILLWMAKTYPRSERREELSWTHHQIVAKLHGKVRSMLLDKAVEERWDTTKLRAEAAEWK